MAIVIINPNSTADMTGAMLAAARNAAPEITFEGWTSDRGPPAIEGTDDGKAASTPLLQLVRKASDQGASGIIIGCFDDTALERAAHIASCPVIGIGQAAFHHCALRQRRFSVVTTLPVSVPVIEDNLTAYGLSGQVGRVRASNVPVLDLEHDIHAATDLIIAESQAAAQEDGVDALVLGCAGMVHVTKSVRTAVSLPVIDPVEAAATSMRWLA
ncbi:aspartate/glutamate racemase family protein [Litoreibacter roseus]|uniref:HyuE hydantoin racemase n=1 Tax=Litoreibacter roseus TaxID=2601869 RepID=A0A6N6JC94_9RHOB|nr:aspartate/glutamate racemase family protein [Litoreibacter roseus]GFE63785.1 HyuE hydantoin racemase [Litoreibacter roseus]